MPDLRQIQLRVPSHEQARTALAKLGFLGDGAAADTAADSVAIGSVQIELERSEPPHGLFSWTFSGDSDRRVPLDPAAAPPTFTTTADPTRSERDTELANGVIGIDHVVLMVPSLEPAVAGLEGYVGLSCRARREMRGRLMAFLRAGDVILELVEIRDLELPQIWGLALGVGDLDATVEAVRARGGNIGAASPSIQGGRIASSPPDALFGVSVAFMEPAPEESAANRRR